MWQISDVLCRINIVPAIFCLRRCRHKKQIRLVLSSEGDGGITIPADLKPEEQATFLKKILTDIDTSLPTVENGDHQTHSKLFSDSSI